MSDAVNEPTSAEVERGTGALLPFVRRWGLSLNPENLQFTAYVVLRHATGTLSHEEVAQDVERMLDEDEAGHARMLAVMKRSIEDQR